MSVLQDIQREAVKRVPIIKTGHTVRVHQKVKEGEKERIQIFEGLVIKISSGHGADKSMTVRKVIEGIGVEKVLPLYSPSIEKIEVKRESKVRRAKLYYMRARSGKSARLKESFVSGEEWEEAVESLAEQKAHEAEESGENEAAETAGETDKAETAGETEAAETEPAEAADEK